MTENQPTTSDEPRPPLIKKALMWAALVVLFWLLFRKVPLEQVLAELHRMTVGQALSLLWLSVVFIIGVTVLDGASMWYGFNRMGAAVPLKEIILARAARMLLDSVATILGQAGLAAHIAQKYRVDAGPAAGMVLFLFFLEIYGMVTLASVSLVLFLALKDMVPPGAPVRAALLMTAAAWAAWLVVMYGGLRMSRVRAARRMLVRLKLAPILGPLERLSRPEISRLLLWKTALAAWQIGLTMIAFRIYGLTVPGLDLFDFMPLTILVSSVPVTPSRLGTTQWSWTFFFGYAAAPAALVWMSLLLQLLLNIVRWGLGATAILWLHRDRKSLDDKGR